MPFQPAAKSVENVVDLSRILAIPSGVTIDKDGMRTEPDGVAQRHGRVHAVFARRIGGGRDNAALVCLASHDDGLPLSEGLNSSSTETKKASMSTWHTTRCMFYIIAHINRAQRAPTALCARA